MAEGKWGASRLITYCRRATVNSSVGRAREVHCDGDYLCWPADQSRVVPLFTFLTRAARAVQREEARLREERDRAKQAELAAQAAADAECAAAAHATRDALGIDLRTTLQVI